MTDLLTEDLGRDPDRFELLVDQCAETMFDHGSFDPISWEGIGPDARREWRADAVPVARCLLAGPREFRVVPEDENFRWEGTAQQARARAAEINGRAMERRRIVFDTGWTDIEQEEA